MPNIHTLSQSGGRNCHSFRIFHTGIIWWAEQDRVGWGVCEESQVKRERIQKKGLRLCWGCCCACGNWTWGNCGGRPCDIDWPGVKNRPAWTPPYRCCTAKVVKAEELRLTGTPIKVIEAPLPAAAAAAELSWFKEGFGGWFALKGFVEMPVMDRLFVAKGFVEAESEKKCYKSISWEVVR